MKLNRGDVVKLKGDILNPGKGKTKIGVILEVQPEINTYRVLICGDTNNISPLGIWVLDLAIEEVLYVADPSPPKIFD
jgi:hypothetical protein